MVKSPYSLSSDELFCLVRYLDVPFHLFFESVYTAQKVLEASSRSERLSSPIKSFIKEDTENHQNWKKWGQYASEKQYNDTIFSYTQDSQNESVFRAKYNKVMNNSRELIPVIFHLSKLYSFAKNESKSPFTKMTGKLKKDAALLFLFWLKSDSSELSEEQKWLSETLRKNSKGLNKQLTLILFDDIEESDCVELLKLTKMCQENLADLINLMSRKHKKQKSINLKKLNDSILLSMIADTPCKSEDGFRLRINIPDGVLLNTSIEKEKVSPSQPPSYDQKRDTEPISNREEQSLTNSHNPPPKPSPQLPPEHRQNPPD